MGEERADSGEVSSTPFRQLGVIGGLFGWVCCLGAGFIVWPAAAAVTESAGWSKEITNPTYWIGCFLSGLIAGWLMPRHLIVGGLLCMSGHILYQYFPVIPSPGADRQFLFGVMLTIPLMVIYPVVLGIVMAKVCLDLWGRGKQAHLEHQRH